MYYLIFQSEKNQLENYFSKRSVTSYKYAKLSALLYARNKYKIKWK